MLSLSPHRLAFANHSAMRSNDLLESLVALNHDEGTLKSGLFKGLFRRNSTLHRKSPATHSSNSSTSSKHRTDLVEITSTRDRRSHSRGRSKREAFHALAHDENSLYYDDDDDDDDADESDDILSHRDHEMSSNSSVNSLVIKNDFFDENGIYSSPGDSHLGTAPWHGIKYDYLVPPRYVKLSRRRKKTPRVLLKLFLAQELNTLTDELASESSDDDSDLSDTPLTQESQANPTRRKSTVNADLSNPREIFAMQFSRDGKYLATGGADGVIKIWKVINSSLVRLDETNKKTNNANDLNGTDPLIQQNHVNPRLGRSYPPGAVFQREPIREFRGHKHNILSLDWSKNNFLISGSMDKTAKLWHVDRQQCLKLFQHKDFVTSVRFHPTDDRFFLLGLLDNSVRLWLILENSIAFENDLGEDVLITAVAFTPDGKRCLIGGFNGSLFSLETKGLHVVHRFEFRQKGTPFHSKSGDKITGIRVLPRREPSEVIDNQPNSTLHPLHNHHHHHHHRNKSPLRGDLVKSGNSEAASTDPNKDFNWNVLITTNDSSIHLVETSANKVVTRFKGLQNNSSSIVADISDDQKYIISGSEDHWCYVWANDNKTINNKLKLILRDIVVDGKQLAGAGKYSKFITKNKLLKKLNPQRVSTWETEDYHFVANENSNYTSFHPHHLKVNVALFAPFETLKLLEYLNDPLVEFHKHEDEIQNFCNENKDSSHHLHDSPNNHLHKTSTFTESIKPKHDAGYIIVTTDQQGNIRVYRQDVAATSRKEVSRYLKRCAQPDTFMPNPDISKACLMQTMEGSMQKKKEVGWKLAKHTRSVSPSCDNINNIRSRLKMKSPGSANTVMNTSGARLNSIDAMSAPQLEFPSLNHTDGSQTLNDGIHSKVLTSSMLNKLNALHVSKPLGLPVEHHIDLSPTHDTSTLVLQDPLDELLKAQPPIASIQREYK